jgi:hypothetical protein
MPPVKVADLASANVDDHQPCDGHGKTQLSYGSVFHVFFH